MCLDFVHAAAVHRHVLCICTMAAQKTIGDFFSKKSGPVNDILETENAAGTLSGNQASGRLPTSDSHVASGSSPVPPYPDIAQLKDTEFHNDTVKGSLLDVDHKVLMLFK